MKKLLALPLMVLFTLPLLAQQAKKYPIGRSGCAASFFCDPGKFEMTLSPDSAQIYTGECVLSEVTYDVICVRFKQPIHGIDTAEMVAEQYLEYLKSTFGIKSAAGYTHGLKLKSKPTARGMADHWKDKDDNDMQIKAWTDGHVLGVLLVVSPQELNDPKTTAFLDSFTFPAK